MKIISVIEYFNKIERSNRWGAPQQARSVDRRLYKQRWEEAMNIYRGRTLTAITGYQS